MTDRLPTESRADRRVKGNGDAGVASPDIGVCSALLVSGNSALYVEHTWDAENRLTSVGPVSQPVGGDIKVECAYNYTDRRVRKRVAPRKRQLSAPEQGGQGNRYYVPLFMRFSKHCPLALATASGELYGLS